MGEVVKEDEELGEVVKEEEEEEECGAWRGGTAVDDSTNARAADEAV